MSVAKTVEISAESSSSFDDAIREGILRASQTIHHIKSAWVKEQKVEVSNGKIVAYRVHMKVTFALEE